MPWDASLLVEEEEPKKSGWDPSLLKEESELPAEEEVAAQVEQEMGDVPTVEPGVRAGARWSLQRGIKELQSLPDTAQYLLAKDQASRGGESRTQAVPRYQAAGPGGTDYASQLRMQQALSKPGRVSGMRQENTPYMDAVAFDLARAREEINAIPRTESQQRMAEAQTSGEKFAEFRKNPGQVLSSVVLESLPPSVVGGLVGSAFGPTGTAAGAGLASFTSTLSGEFLANAQKQGVDVTDPKALSALLEDDKKFQAAYKPALLKAGIVGTIDTATAKMAGRFVEPAMKLGLKKTLIASGKELGMQAGGGAGGEFLGQVATGQPIDPFDIAMEGLAEVAGAPSEIAGNVYNARKQAAAQTQAAPAASPPVAVEVPTPALEQINQELAQGGGAFQEPAELSQTEKEAALVPEQAAPVPVEEAPISPNDFVPALRPKGKDPIVGKKGQIHQDIYNDQGKTEGMMLRMEQPEHGFVRDGKFVTKEELTKLLGENVQVDSQRLRELQEKANEAKTKAQGQVEAQPSVGETGQAGQEAGLGTSPDNGRSELLQSDQGGIVEDLSQTEKPAASAFERASQGDEKAFDELHQKFKNAPETEELSRTDPNTVRTAQAFVDMFEKAFTANDFGKFLTAIKATSDVSIWKPYLKRLFREQATNPLSAQKAEWFRHVFTGSRPTSFTAGPQGTTPGPPPTPQPSPPPQQPQPPAAPPPPLPPPRISVEPIKGGGAKSPFQIIKDFQAAMKKAVRVRKLKRGTLGTYSPGSTLTADKFAGDLDTTAHELAGHWADDKNGIGKPWMNDPTSPYDAELAKFWIHGSVTPTSTPKYKRAEGIAEFIRAYIVNPNQAAREAPGFFDYFKDTITPEDLNAIHDFSRDVRIWAGEDPVIRAGLNIRMDPPGLRERLDNAIHGRGFGFETGLADKLRLWFDDPYHYAVKAFHQIHGLFGTPLLPQDNFELLSRLLATHDSRMSDQFENGLAPLRPGQAPNAQGRLEVERVVDLPTGQEMSLKWLLGAFDTADKAKFNQDMRDASALMVAQRTLEKGPQLGRQDRISGIGAGILTDTKAAQELIDRLRQEPARFDKLREAARRYRAWADANIRMLVDSGRMTPQAALKIFRDNQQYVDMHRLSEEFETGFRAQHGKNIGSAKNVINRFKGATLELGNVYNNLLEQTDAIQKEAHRNVTMNAFNDGLRQIRTLYGPDLKDLDQFGSRAGAGDASTIAVWKDGKREDWKYAPEIYENLKGLGELGTHPFIDLLSKLPQFFRYMVTHSPQFITRNIARDTMERTVQSRSGGRPWDILGGYSQEELSRYEVFGGGQFGNYIVDKHVWNKEIKRVAAKLTKDPSNLLLNPLKLKRAWETLSEKSEKLGRIAEFRRAFERGKTELGYDDYNAALYAAGEARGLLDFAKAGTVMKVINRLIPFSNAAMRGLGRSYTGLTENPARYVARWALTILAPTLGVMAWNRRDEEVWKEYLQLPAYRRDMFWNIKVGDHWLVFPKPHLLGILSGGVERAVIAALGEKHAGEGYGGTLASQLPVQNLAEATGPLKNALELTFNRDTFRNRDIIPPWEKDLKLELRKGAEHASGAGKGLAAALNTTGLQIDPRQMDYLLNSYGGVGQIVTTATSPGKRPGIETAIKTTGFVSDPPIVGARDVQWVFDWARKNGKIQASQIEELAKFRKVVLDEKDSGERAKKAALFRDYASKLREAIEAAEKRK